MADLSGLRIPKESKDSSPLVGRPRSRVWMGLVAMFVLLGGPAWWAFGIRTPEVETASVMVQQEGAKSMPILSASGYISAHQQVVVAVKTPGRIEKILVEEGDRVKKGQLLAELDASELKANLERAEAEYEDALRQLKRYQNMWGEKIIAKAELDRVETTYKISKASLDATKARLEDMMIRAPFDGTILKKHIELGHMPTAGPGQDAFTIADLDQLDVEVDVSEGNIQKISSDHPVEVVAEALPDKMVRGRVFKIAPTANRQKAIIEVSVRILDKDVRLKPEMSVKVTFVEREAPVAVHAKPRVLVPKAAVLTEGNKKAVWSLEAAGRKFRLRKVLVECGKEWTEYYEVAKGLVGGETVVTGGMESLAEGQLVRVKSEK